jgi:two-component system response regulator DesR
MIRIVLAEDQAMVRGALAALLGLEGDLQIVAEAGDGDAGWKAVEAHRPDLLVTDIEMPGLTGLDLALKLRDANLPTRVVVLTTFARAGYLRRALEAGVRGDLLKDALAVAAWGEEDPLSERERQVLRLAGEGVKSAEIAARLHLSQGTVRNYLSEAIGKLGAGNRIEAYRTARARGWL